MHTWKLVPHAHAHLGYVAFCTCTLGREFPSTVLSVAATLLQQERYSCKHLAIHRQRFLTCVWHMQFPTHGPDKQGDKCRMDVLNAHHCLQPMPLGINCPLFSKHFAHSPSHAAKSASAWALALRCACARGTCAQVCMRRGTELKQ